MEKFFAFVIVFVVQFNSVFAFYDLVDDEVVDVDEILEVTNLTQGKPAIQATSAILFDRISKRILFEKDIHKKVPNASTTKILTAIVASENGNMLDVVTISKKAVNIGGSKVKFRVGDKITLNDLMLGMLLCSGNDCAVAIAEHIGGDVDGFCEMLNEKAREIGAINTNFTSPHGLDDEDHYSTAYDLAIISDYALNIPIIANIVSRKSAVIRINGNSRQINNTNEMLSCYEGANGIKTGFTNEAGRCLVTSATRDDWQLISVVLGCNSKKQRTLESTKLLNYGFQNFKIVDLCEKMPESIDFSVKKAPEKVYNVAIKNEFFYPLTFDEIQNLHYEYTINDLEASILKGSIIGQVSVKIGDKIICIMPIKADRNIERKGIFEFFYEISINLLKITRVVGVSTPTVMILTYKIYKIFP